MEFSMLGLEGLVSSTTGFPSTDHGKQKCCGSAAGFLKSPEKPLINVSHHDDDVGDGDDFRASKIPKVRENDLSASSKNSSSFVFSDDGQQEHNMLSFSSPKMEDFSLKCSGDLDTKNLQKSAAFLGYFQYPTPAYSKIPGYSCPGGVSATGMYFLNGVKGPFTPAQWIELEHQALIYKYITANEPIPPTLLIPIRRAFESAGFFSFPGGLLRPSSFGWGPFHLGYSNSTDPEPGRCRRTDGKKWRCSREAMPDQKYCERHMNRGRHRSRKPVEGQTGHPLSGSTKTTNSSQNITNAAVVASSTSAPGVAASDTFASDHHTSSSSSLVNRLMMNRQNSSQGVQDASGLNNFLSPPTISLSCSSSNLTYPIARSEHIPFAESTPAAAAGFGVLTSEPLYRTYTDLNAPDSNSHSQQHSNSTRALMDDFMSSTSSPAGERDPLSPLRLSGELEMGLGVGSERSQKQSNWVPISWESSMGGPLGEALKATGNNSESHGKNVTSSSSLKLSALSPTGVLQRTPLGSLSNSSAGSSPRGLGVDGGNALGS